MSKEAMKLALEALELCNGAETAEGVVVYTDKEITALREALAEQPAQQEPVAYLCENAVGHKYFRWKKPLSTYKPIALYTSPPAQRTWVGLDDTDLANCTTEEYETARYWEAKLKEKNT